jgi:hypothetical protein
MLERCMTLKDFRIMFESYFNAKKPNYKYPGPLFGMAFYCTKHKIGVTLEDMITGKTSLDEYGDILYKLFSKMNSKNPYGRMSAYKDAMKNLLEFVEEYNLQNIIIE